MVTTRRQSGRLPAPLVAASPNEADEDEDDFGGYESPMSDSTDNDDDFTYKSSGEYLFIILVGRRRCCPEY
jgi:hypothetical protein